MRSLGLYAWFGYDLSLEEALRRMRDAGFDSVMLWWGEFDGGVPLSRQPDLARRLGLEVANAHAPFAGCNHLWLPGEEGDRYIDAVVRCAQECAACGVTTLVVHLTDGPAPPAPTQLGLSRVRRALEAADRAGVALALENLRHPAYLADVFDALGRPSGFCYDSGHARVEFDPGAGKPRGADLPRRYADRLCAVHLHDNDGALDRHWLPFDGVIDWSLVSAQLRAARYKGPLTLETQAFGWYETRLGVDAFLDRAYRSAARLRALLDGPSSAVGEWPPLSEEPRRAP